MFGYRRRGDTQRGGRRGERDVGRGGERPEHGAPPRCERPGLLAAGLRVGPVVELRRRDARGRSHGTVTGDVRLDVTLGHRTGASKERRARLAADAGIGAEWHAGSDGGISAAPRDDGPAVLPRPGGLRRVRGLVQAVLCHTQRGDGLVRVLVLENRVDELGVRHVNLGGKHGAVFKPRAKVEQWRLPLLGDGARVKLGPLGYVMDARRREVVALVRHHAERGLAQLEPLGRVVQRADDESAESLEHPVNKIRRQSNCPYENNQK